MEAMSSGRDEDSSATMSINIKMENCYVPNNINYGTDLWRSSVHHPQLKSLNVGGSYYQHPSQTSVDLGFNGFQLSPLEIEASSLGNLYSLSTPGFKYVNANNSLFPSMSVNVSMSMSMGYGHHANQQWSATPGGHHQHDQYHDPNIYQYRAINHVPEPESHGGSQHVPAADMLGAEVLYNRPQNYHGASRSFVSHYMLKKARGLYRQNVGGVQEKSSSSSSSSSSAAAKMSGAEKPNLCRICGKMYARPSTLKTHMRTHSGEKPYRCTDCNKSFSQAANLTAHIRTHSGEKPFHCPICDRQFSQSSSVTTHMRIHSGERPYRCRLCSKSFSDSSTLTKHLRIHSGEKPYQCKLCLLKFSQSGNLKRHLRVHSSG
ncbi:PREDICTED: protein glass-like [Priapulus caudatus]|uniref:Protein glass-like n=1 Tax=Priapulus caudatus TaxID=37621 RepID=A0ABM1DTV8_PRICU|nr:PREDICTED: protein glass-like [Priapulus caudatus]